jgi:hypothetical protein
MVPAHLRPSITEDSRHKMFQGLFLVDRIREARAELSRELDNACYAWALLRDRPKAGLSDLERAYAPQSWRTARPTPDLETRPAPISSGSDELGSAAVRDTAVNRNSVAAIPMPERPSIQKAPSPQVQSVIHIWDPNRSGVICGASTTHRVFAAAAAKAMSSPELLCPYCLQGLNGLQEVG